MNAFARILSLVAAAAVVSACDELPVQPTTDAPSSAAAAPSLSTSGATPQVVEALYDLSDVFAGIICDDGTESELIALQGQVYERWQTVFTPVGDVHSVVTTMPIDVKGIGTETGEEYRVTYHDVGAWNQRETGYAGGYRSVTKFVGVDSRVEFSIITMGRLVVNANGEYVVDRHTETGECGG